MILSEIGIKLRYMIVLGEDFASPVINIDCHFIIQINE